jgi:hypothetical protein
MAVLTPYTVQRPSNLWFLELIFSALQHCTSIMHRVRLESLIEQAIALAGHLIAMSVQAVMPATIAVKHCMEKCGMVTCISQYVIVGDAGRVHDTTD